MWIYKNKEFNKPENEQFGFVYLITNLVTGRKYIGKKFLWTYKTRTKKGKKKREKIESDWKSYYGSSKELLEDKEKLGKEFFKREILEFCPTRGILGYKELVYQVDMRVLEKPNEYYNGFLGSKISRSHIKDLINKQE